MITLRQVQKLEVLAFYGINKYTYVDLAARFGVGRSTIGNIICLSQKQQ